MAWHADFVARRCFAGRFPPLKFVSLGGFCPEFILGEDLDVGDGILGEGWAEEMLHFELRVGKWYDRDCRLFRKVGINVKLWWNVMMRFGNWWGRLLTFGRIGGWMMGILEKGGWWVWFDHAEVFPGCLLLRIIVTVYWFLFLFFIFPFLFDTDVECIDLMNHQWMSEFTEYVQAWELYILSISGLELQIMYSKELLSAQSF